MQYTSQHQFNLVESGDTFSPTPLNENMEKVEAALSAAATAVDTKIATALAALGVGGSTCRIAHGSFTGTGYKPRTITFEFKPLVVFLVCPESSAAPALGTTLIRSAQKGSGSVSAVSWADRSITYGSTSSDSFNSSSQTTYYVAIGVGDD